MKPLDFQTDLQLEDYAGLCWLRSSKTAYLIAVAGAIFVGLTLRQPLAGKPWLWPLIAVAALFLLFFGVRFYIMMRAKKIYRMATVSERLTLHVDENGITQQSRSGETVVTWDEVTKVAENRDCYFVFFLRNKAFYFPKRNFASAEDRALFRDWMIEFVSPARIHFKS